MYLQYFDKYQSIEGTYSTQRNYDLTIEIIGISSTTVKSSQNATF